PGTGASHGAQPSTQPLGRLRRAPRGRTRGMAGTVEHQREPCQPVGRAGRLAGAPDLPRVGLATEGWSMSVNGCVVVAIEGTHAAGKTTLVHALTAHYRERGVLVTCTG